MFTETVQPDFAAQLESCEINAWLDMYAALPSDFARTFQLEIIQTQELVLTRCRNIPFVHFNCVMNLGITATANEQQLDEARVRSRSSSRTTRSCSAMG